MAQMLPIKMSKFDNQPWGFRIQGGIDFAAPLTVQKVNGGSLAEKAGLCVGDNLIRVNNTDIYQMRHKDAQDSISKAGNNFELVVSRGGLKPKVISAPLPLPTTAVPAAAVSNGDAVQQSEGSRLVNKQFNSPMGLYSEENIAETLSSQAEVLAQGVLGVNFKKNEKTYDPANSEVFKMVQEMARLPKEAEPESQQQRTVLSPLPNKSSFPGFPTAGIVPPAGGVRCFPAAPEPSPTLTGIRQSPMVESESIDVTTISTAVAVGSSFSSESVRKVETVESVESVKTKRVTEVVAPVWAPFEVYFARGPQRAGCSDSDDDRLDCLNRYNQQTSKPSSYLAR